MFSSVAGRRVLITGATRGIGRGMALVFARADASLVLAGPDAVSGSAAATAALEAGAAHAVFLEAELASCEGCQRLAAAAVETLGGVDVLLANAGVYPELGLSALDEAMLDEVLDVNLKGTIWALQACVPALERSDAGRVVVTSSITGTITGLPGFSHYAASKAAQVGFVRSAALELAPSRITVNALLPGKIATAGLAELGEAYLALLTASVPLGGLGSVDDVGYAAFFLASREAGFITGQPLVVDGGQVLPESRAWG